jgi:hypothetical protein
MIRTIVDGELSLKPETATDFIELMRDLSKSWGAQMPDDQLSQLADVAVIHGKVIEDRPSKRN